jgi:hypothetical protein
LLLFLLLLVDRRLRRPLLLLRLLLLALDPVVPPRIKQAASVEESFSLSLPTLPSSTRAQREHGSLQLTKAKPLAGSRIGDRRTASKSSAGDAAANATSTAAAMRGRSRARRTTCPTASMVALSL